MKITKKTKRNRCHQLLPCYLGGLLFRIGLGVLCDFQCLVLHDLHCCLHARCHDLGAGGFWGQVWWVSRGFTHQLLVVSVDISEIYIYISVDISWYQLISVVSPWVLLNQKLGNAQVLCCEILIENAASRGKGSTGALELLCARDAAGSDCEATFNWGLYIGIGYWYTMIYIYIYNYIYMYIYIYIHWGYICMYIGYWFVSKNMCRV